MPCVRAVACLARQRATHLFFAVTHQNKPPSPPPSYDRTFDFSSLVDSPSIFSHRRGTTWKIHRTKSFRNRERIGRLPFRYSLFLFLFFLFFLLLEGNAAVKTVVLRRGAREIYDTPFNITRKVNISRRGKFKENVVTGATEHAGVS